MARSGFAHLLSANHTLVQRTAASFNVSDAQQMKKKLMSWANHFDSCCFLDNHHYQFPHHAHECLVAAGSTKKIEANAGEAFKNLREFSDQHQDWLFGHFSFDLKNEIELLSSTHPDHIGFPDLSFVIS